MKSYKAKPEHEIAYQEIAALVSRHKDQMTPLDMLAVASNLVGKLVAMQDQRNVTPEQALMTVQVNLELGNQQAIASIRDVPPKGRA